MDCGRRDPGGEAAEKGLGGEELRRREDEAQNSEEALVRVVSSRGPRVTVHRKIQVCVTVPTLQLRVIWIRLKRIL